MEEVMFIINPVAGRGKGRALADSIAGRPDLSFRPVILFTGKTGDAAGFVSRGVKRGISKFIAVGGDGTVNEVASAIVENGGILGVIPSGSGNGLARHLKLPFRIERALKVFSQGRIREIDYGLAGNTPFFCVSGVGFDAAVGHAFAEGRGRGFISYAVAAVNLFLKYRPLKYRIVFDDGRVIRRRAFLVTFANASQYGNNAYIAPDADISDGLLDVCILRPFNIIRIPEIVFGLFGKKLAKSSLLEIIRCKEAVLKRKRAGYFHYDGEPSSCGKKIRFRIKGRGLKVMVP